MAQCTAKRRVPDQVVEGMHALAKSLQYLPGLGVPQLDDLVVAGAQEACRPSLVKLMSFTPCSMPFYIQGFTAQWRAASSTDMAVKSWARPLC